MVNNKNEHMILDSDANHSIGLFWTQLDQNLPQVCIFLLGILEFGRMLALFISFLDIYFIYKLDISAMGTFSIPV